MAIKRQGSIGGEVHGFEVGHDAVDIQCAELCIDYTGGELVAGAYPHRSVVQVQGVDGMVGFHRDGVGGGVDNGPGGVDGVGGGATGPSGVAPVPVPGAIPGKGIGRSAGLNGQTRQVNSFPDGVMNHRDAGGVPSGKVADQAGIDGGGVIGACAGIAEKGELLTGGGAAAGILESDGPGAAQCECAGDVDTTAGGSQIHLVDGAAVEDCIAGGPEGATPAVARRQHTENIDRQLSHHAGAAECGPRRHAILGNRPGVADGAQMIAVGDGSIDAQFANIDSGFGGIGVLGGQFKQPVAPLVQSASGSVPVGEHTRNP